MKKKLLCNMLMTTVVFACMAASPAQKVSKGEFVPISPWTLGVKGGANYFRVAPEPVSRLDQVHLVSGGSLEFSFNPVAGMGLEYLYSPYSRSYYLDATQTATGRINGKSQDAVLYGSVNLSNLFTPYRYGFPSKLNVFSDVGVGYAFYNNSLDVNTPDGIAVSPMGKVGMNVEYNFTKSLAIGWDGYYRFYHRRLVSGDKPDRSNALTMTIGLRYKLGGKNDRPHARNISMYDYYPKPAPVIIEKPMENYMAEMNERVKAIEDENAALKDEIKKLSGDLAKNAERNMLDKGFRNIEFAFGSDMLSGNAFNVLDQIAVLLKENPESVKLSVAGHTDYVGAEEFNRALSIRRANAVKAYLMAIGVPESSILIAGYGKDKPIATNETREGRQKNRRVEFLIAN
ncbi:MAG TPA: OmpA family protein [Paludibacter sp.]|nr:OmpA family protein [Paludibacter sp.]